MSKELINALLKSRGLPTNPEGGVGKFFVEVTGRYGTAETAICVGVVMLILSALTIWWVKASAWVTVVLAIGAIIATVGACLRIVKIGAVADWLD